MDFLISLLTNPAVQSLITLGLASMAGYIAKSWSSDVRWDKITRIATGIIQDLYSKGITKWEDVVLLTMKQIVKETTAHPGMSNLTTREVEKLKGFVVEVAQRKNGVILKPGF